MGYGAGSSDSTFKIVKAYLMRFLLNVIRFSFVAVGIACCMAGMAQIDSAQPDFYISRTIAELQSDTVKVLKGIALILLGIASGVFALAFHNQPPKKEEL